MSDEERAREVWADIKRLCETCRLHAAGSFIQADGDEIAEKKIAAALRAERERCAERLEKRADTAERNKRTWPAGHKMRAVQSAIVAEFRAEAAAIRALGEEG